MAKTELEDDGVIDTPEAQGEPEITNYRDEINNDVAAALRQLKGETPEKAETPDEIGEPPETGKPEKTAKPDKARDETGKFAKAELTEAPEKAAPEPKSASKDEPAKVSVQPAPTPFDAPPAGWTPDAKQAWTALKTVLPTLSPEVQASISAIQAAAVKREQDMSAGGRQWSTEKRQYETVLSPIAEAAQRNGIPVDEGVKRLVAANDFLERDAPSAIMWLAKSYGVDLTALVSNPPAPQPQRFVDPMVPQLNDKVSSLESQLKTIMAGHAQNMVNSFAASPGHEHFGVLEDDLMEYIPEIQAAYPRLAPEEVLQKAYDRAVWLNAGVREKIFAEQSAAAEKANADKLAETERARVAAVTAKAGKSAKAAISIKGSSTGAAATPKVAVNGTGDVYDDVRSAMRQLREERA